MTNNFESVEELAAAVTRQGGDAVARDHEPFADALRRLLRIDPSQITNYRKFRAALTHGFAYYYWKWDPRAADLYDDMRAAIEAWSRPANPDLDLLCELFDFFYFVVWCFSGSNAEQCRRAVPTMRVASAALARTSDGPHRRPPPRAGDRVRVAWLAMFADAANPMSVALRIVASALRQTPHYQLLVYAWRFADPGLIEWLRGQGAVCHVIRQAPHAEVVASLEARAAADRPAVAISDMNNGIPTALFSRRLAPVQVFLQAGMPAWPVCNLDAVFNSFGIAPDLAGWNGATMLEFNPPWELTSLVPRADAAELERERASLPRARKLIGCYGRLVKVTDDYLRAVERILLQCPDTAFVVGGTGDPDAIRRFAARSQAGPRIHVEDRFVPGHTWDRLLDVFLDTWPLQGGESCRQAIAKGCPVVTMHSAEMPALDAQRDPLLLAGNWDAVVDTAGRLLQDAAARDQAKQRGLALAASMADGTRFVAQLDRDLAMLLQRARSDSAAAQ